MRRFLRFFVGLAACGVFIFAGARLASYIRENIQSISLNKSLAEEAVVEKKTEAVVVDSILEQTEEETSAVPIEVDFEVLLETNTDVIGWLYCEDTPLNFPVVQGKDNEFYLHHMLDGTWNSSGTLFVDFRNTYDFSDRNTIIYGHHMKNKGMFGSLSYYKKQTYFDKHPVMWLLTPKMSYKVELVAGYVTSATSEIYTDGLSEEDFGTLVQKMISQSTFVSDVQVSEEDKFLTLSTCSYEYDNARYVLLGRMTAVSNQEVSE